MFNNDKKPGPSGGMSSWFSSLRRQPKKQKSLESSKLLQKSCVDLSANHAGSNQDLVLNLRMTNVNKNTPSSASILCANCCCRMNRSKSPLSSLGSGAETPILTPEDELLDAEILTSQQLRKVTVNNEESFNNANNTQNTQNTRNFSNNILLYNKKEEFSRTTKTSTTKITKTTMISNGGMATKQHYRAGLVFNENGQLINRKLILNQKHREGLVFDDKGRLMDPNCPNSPISPITPISIIDDSTFEYIDSASDIYNRENLCSCKSIGKKSKSEWSLSNNKQIKDELSDVVHEMETHDSVEDSKHSNKDKQMTIGRKKFNMDPKKGIEFLYENHLLTHDAQDVAQFLYKGEGLNKTAIGDYLGEKNDFNELVLKKFVELHDFTNLILVQALRQFLWSFRLPGEAQKIDRMMECFAQHYCQLNTDIFTNTDTCYVLSFAIIMLNTSLHNPSVKDKPTVEQFISMNRGINNGGDLPRELLESLYESIRTEPFKIPQDDGNDLCHTFFNPDKEGWLWKQGGRYKSWKRRWFILNDNCLYYFEYTTDKEPRGIIPLENISVREIIDRSKPHCFELYASGGADIIKACKTDSEGKVVEGNHKVYRMSAATEEEKLEWINHLGTSISTNPFYDILQTRKKLAKNLS